VNKKIKYTGLMLFISIIFSGISHSQISEPLVKTRRVLVTPQPRIIQPEPVYQEPMVTPRKAFPTNYSKPIKARKRVLPEPTKPMKMPEKGFSRNL